MASINSVTGSLSSTSSLRGFGGLSSGLDRDTLIESLTYATRTKIEQQQAKKEKLGWEQTILRNVIDKAYNFTNSYASYTSTTNLASSSFFARSNIEAVGENSKYVSVTGTSANSNLFTVLGVKQLASDAKLTGSTASSSTLTTGVIDFTKQVPVDNLSGTYFNLKVGDKSYSIDIKDIDLDTYDKPQDAIVAALNKEFEAEGLNSGDIQLNASVDGNAVKINVVKGGGNEISISGSGLSKLGLEEGVVEGNAITIGEEAINKAITYNTASTILPGKTLTFNYNGTSKDIKLGSDATTLEGLKNSLQEQLDKAFGKGRIEVGTKDGALTFKTMNVQNGGVDNTSTLSITGGSSGLLGTDGVFGIKSGTSNRVDLSKSLEASGLANTGKLRETNISDDSDEKGYSMVINGHRFAFSKDTSIQDIINEVNASDAGVKISYSSSADKFSISSTEQGASGKIEMYGGIAEAMFGSAAFTEEAGMSWKVASVTGQDAIIAVKYAGDSEETEIYRSSNSFTMDGLTVTVNGTFGYEGDKVIGDSEAVQFKATADVDKIMKGITDMVNAYNEIVALINSELKTKPDKDYKTLLTASQKEDMTDDEIEDYEKKAKQGLLFGDSDLRSFANDLRYVLAGSDIAKLAEIGITESSEYSDNGKLVIDEAKLRAALEADPEAVGELFAGKENADGTTSAGLVDNMKTVMDRYCGTVGATKGLLVQRAGSDHSPLSLLDNTMKSEIDDITDYIEKLLDRLESEEDRYIAQFTTLETLIAEMNSQSSYLSSLSGY